MVVGFLFPIAMAIAEWAFFYPNLPKATRLGVIQMVFPFVGGIVLMLALLLSIDPLAPVAILLELIGVGIFVYRMWPEFRKVDWMQASSARYAMVSALGSAWVIGLAQYFVIKHEGDFDLVPTHQILALDHSQFILATTNAVFAMLLMATVAKGTSKLIDQLTFLLVNVGIIGFVIALLGDVTVMKQIFAPIMGVGLLIGLGTFGWRLVVDDEPEAGAGLALEVGAVRQGQNPCRRRPPRIARRRRCRRRSASGRTQGGSRASPRAATCSASPVRGYCETRLPASRPAASSSACGSRPPARPRPERLPRSRRCKRSRVGES